MPLALQSNLVELDLGVSDFQGEFLRGVRAKDLAELIIINFSENLLFDQSLIHRIEFLKMDLNHVFLYAGFF